MFIVSFSLFLWSFSQVVSIVPTNQQMNNNTNNQNHNINKTEIKCIDNKSDNKITTGIDKLNESIYKIKNFFKLTKDIDELRRDNMVKDDIKRKLSLKEQWLRNSSGENLAESPSGSFKSNWSGSSNLSNVNLTDINPNSAKQNFSHSSLDGLNIRSTNQNTGNFSAKFDSLQNLQISTPNLSTTRKEFSEMKKEEQDDVKFDDALDFDNLIADHDIVAERHNLADAMKKIEVKNFSDTMNHMKTQFGQPKVTTNKQIDLSKYFPKKDQPVAHSNINKNQKDLKDVDLSKYFTLAPVQEPTASPIPSRKNSMLDGKPPIKKDPREKKDAANGKMKKNSTKSFDMSDQQLDGAVELNSTKKFKNLKRKYKSFENDDLDVDLFDKLVEENVTAIEQADLFDEQNLDGSAENIDEIFEGVAAELIDNDDIKMECEEENDDDDEDDDEDEEEEMEIITSIEKRPFKPSMIRMEIQRNSIDQPHELTLTYHKPAPAWCKKSVLEQKDPEVRFETKMSNSLKEQIRLMELYLMSAEPLAVLEDFDSFKDKNELPPVPVNGESAPKIKKKIIKKVKKPKADLTKKTLPEKSELLVSSETKGENIKIPEKISIKKDTSFEPLQIENGILAEVPVKPVRRSKIKTESSSCSDSQLLLKNSLREIENQQALLRQSPKRDLAVHSDTAIPSTKKSDSVEIKDSEKEEKISTPKIQFRYKPLSAVLRHLDEPKQIRIVNIQKPIPLQATKSVCDSPKEKEPEEEPKTLDRVENHLTNGIEANSKPNHDHDQTLDSIKFNYKPISRYVEPQRPYRKNDPVATNRLIKKSQDIHNKKQEFIEEILANANPYMKKMMEQDFDQDSDLKRRSMHGIPTTTMYNGAAKPTLSSRDSFSYHDSKAKSKSPPTSSGYSVPTRTRENFYAKDQYQDPKPKSTMQTRSSANTRDHFYSSDQPRSIANTRTNDSLLARTTAASIQSPRDVSYMNDQHLSRPTIASTVPSTSYNTVTRSSAGASRMATTSTTRNDRSTGSRGVLGLFNKNPTPKPAKSGKDGCNIS